ncbi:MAG: SH3 domain-containing protein [Treponema sp.]|nr:SH3 domain-containing protein [Treponema sp.]
MKAFSRVAPAFFLGALFLFSGLFSSCSKSLGYSLVLWHDDEHALTDGEIVQVFIRSNISHVYVIALPGTNQKVEVPLWLLSEPDSRKKTQKLRQRYADYEHTYASVKLDGLPIRQEAVNTAKQVYRLREKEIIRVLYKGKGQAVTNGRGNIEGDWLRVLTEGGTTGWCFSYNLDLFQLEDGAALTAKSESTALTPLGGAEEGEATDTVIAAVKGQHWYPEKFQTLIDRGRIDLAQMDTGYGFVIDEKSNTISITLSGTMLSWTYTGITKTKEHEYQFNGTPVKITVRRNDFIIVEYRDSSRKVQEENMVLLTANLDELLQEEAERRQKELEQLRLYGPRFESSNYGKLSFTETQGFTWSGYNLLVPSIISKDAKGSGSVSIRYFISDALKVSYDGVLTFRFDGMPGEVNFLYKITDGGLRLEDATKAQMANNVILSRSTSPLVIFFNKQ